MEQQNRLDNARSWLRRARKDYLGYEKVVGYRYLHSRVGVPEDPALAIYLLQQANEKAIKAIAVASGEFTQKELLQNYGHNSLLLYSELILRILNKPLMGEMLSLFRQSLGEVTGKLFNREEAEKRLAEIKQGIRKGTSPKTPDMFMEFATLPSDQISKIIALLIKLRSLITSDIFRQLQPTFEPSANKIASYISNPTKDEMERMITPAFRGGTPPQGVDFFTNLVNLATGAGFEQILIKAIRNDPEYSNTCKSQKIKRVSIEKFFLSAWAFSVIILLAAFTFPHESSSRYPGNRKSDCTKADSIKVYALDCDSYTIDLGIVRSLNEVGGLTKLVLNDIEKMIEIVNVAWPFKVHDDAIS